MQAPLPPRVLEIREPAAAVAPLAEDATVLAQLGAWRTRGKAEETLRAVRAADASPTAIRIARAQVRGVVWWRVVAGPMRSNEAQALCQRLSRPAASCWVRAIGAE